MSASAAKDLKALGESAMAPQWRSYADEDNFKGREAFIAQAGGKSFRIMTIDIHTVQDGKLVEAYHVEDWAGAIRQLSAK